MTHNRRYQYRIFRIQLSPNGAAEESRYPVTPRPYGNNGDAQRECFRRNCTEMSDAIFVVIKEVK